MDENVLSTNREQASFPIPRLQAPQSLALHDISLVIPVKNNQEGINRFLSTFFTTYPPEKYPCEILLIDNLSSPPLHLPMFCQKYALPLHLLRCRYPGPASARNMGIAHAKGEWILFTDSDCIPTLTSLEGYQAALDGSIGYAGSVFPLGEGFLAGYYQRQKIFLPPLQLDKQVRRPCYLITANALLWKPALQSIGGFYERFRSPAGEDIDLSLRLMNEGTLAYAPDAVIMHACGGLLTFMSRFIRYGRGNRQLGKLYAPFGQPPPLAFLRSPFSLQDRFLACLHYLCFLWGYLVPGNLISHPGDR